MHYPRAVCGPLPDPGRAVPPRRVCYVHHCAVLIARRCDWFGSTICTYFYIICSSALRALYHGVLAPPFVDLRFDWACVPSVDRVSLG